MKKLFIFFISMFVVGNLSAQSLKFSPFLGVDYSLDFNGKPKPLFGLDFSYEFNNGIELGFGSYLSKTKVASRGDEIRPNILIDFRPEVKESPVYLFFKYNYTINSKFKISPYVKVGQLRTSTYNNYEDKLSNNKDLIKDDTILYGNNFYSLGLQYSYNNYYLAVEYKVRMLEQEYLHSEYIYNNQNDSYSSSGYYSNRTFKANSISFIFGYNFDTKNKSPINIDNSKKRYSPSSKKQLKTIS